MKTPDIISLNKKLDRIEKRLDTVKNKIQILLDNDKLFKRKHYHRYIHTSKGSSIWKCTGCPKTVSSI